MIAETLAGIALVKQSVDFIKSNINTAKDIGDISWMPLMGCFVVKMK